MINHQRDSGARPAHDWAWLDWGGRRSSQQLPGRVSGRTWGGQLVSSERGKGKGEGGERANERAMGWMDRAGAMPRVTAQNRARGSTLRVVAELAKMLRPRWNDGNRTPKTLMPGILWRSSGSASCSGLCPERRPLMSVLGRCYWLSGGLRGENRKLSQQQFHQHPLWCGAPAPSAPGDGGTGDQPLAPPKEPRGPSMPYYRYCTSYLPSRTSGCPPACHPSHLSNSSGDGPGSKANGDRPRSPESVVS